MALIGYDEQTSIYNAPVLSVYKPPSGGTTSVPANTGPDAGNTSELVIPMVLTTYAAPIRTPKINTIGVVPMQTTYSGANTSWGGTILAEGPSQLPRIQLEGHIDTPRETDGDYEISALKIEDIRYSFPDYIATLWEGRGAFFASLGYWQKIEPLWFRDPYGRKFTNLKIIDFNASYIEGVPQRNSFSMQLMVPGELVT